MSKLLQASLIFGLCAATSVYADMQPIAPSTDCNGPLNVIINFNSNMPNATITAYSKYFGEGGMKFSKTFSPVTIPGNTPIFTSNATNALCMKQYKQAFFAGVTQISTNNYGPQVLTNCGIKIRPKDVDANGKTVNISISWDQAKQQYVCATSGE